MTEPTTPPDAATSDLERVRSVAAEAHRFGYAMVENYRTLHAQAVDPADPRYVGGFGVYRHYSEPFTPQNTDIVTPNNDTPYSWLWLDLRTEPWVITVPAVDRYYIVPVHDLYTVYSGYVGSRTTGSGPGSYLVAGPGWDGTVPDSITGVIRASTDVVGSLTRTALVGHDVEGLKAVQHSYSVQPLSAYQQTPPPPPAPAVEWPAWDEQAASGLGFYDYLDHLLSLAPVLDEDREVRARMATVGLDGTGRFASPALDEGTASAFAAGLQDSQRSLDEQAEHMTTSIGIFGTREEMAGRYDARNQGAKKGLYGLPPAEAWYGGWVVDAEGNHPVGSRDYTIHFSADELPKAQFFWSATLYTLPERLLSANPIDRYSIGDRTPGLHYGDDGSLTITVSHDAPHDEDARANWLPAPSGPFTVIIRAYGGDERIVEGRYTLPPLTPVPGEGGEG